MANQQGPHNGVTRPVSQSPIPTDPRRYDLDWLRVAAFAILILYHVGMFYVTWDWHVKSRHASDGAEWLMRLVNPWRLPLLFFISGIAVRFVADAWPPRQLALSRLLRLGVPIVFGMAVVVAPQAWLELVAKGEFSGGFGAFYPRYLDPTSGFSIITPTWNHLWYVVYILVYTLLLAPLARPLAALMRGGGHRVTTRLFAGPAGGLVVLAVLALPQIVIDLTIADLYPTTHNLVADWANHAHCITVFLVGFLLAKDAALWRAVGQSLRLVGSIALVLWVLFAALWLSWDDVRATVVASPLLSALVRTARIVSTWATILTLLALAQRYLDRPSRALRYATEAVFPWYILHQTVLIAAGVWLTGLGLPAWTEVTLVIASVVIGCALLHELVIRRLWFVRPLFGLRPARKALPTVTSKAPGDTVR